MLGQFICAYKWKLLADSMGYKSKLTEYYDYYLVGMFFNLFLPTTVGGDVAKCYYLAKRNPGTRRSPAVYSVLAERFSGVAVIIWMCTIAMFTSLGDPVSWHFKLFMSLLSLAIIIVPPIFPWACRTFFPKNKWVKRMLKDTEVYWSRPDLVFKALYWSILFHILIFCIHIAIGHAMGLKISYAYYLIVYPMTAVAGFIPLSFNGLGPREWTYSHFFALVGIKSSAALAFSIFWFGIVVLSSLIGGIFYIKGKRTPPPEEFEIEEDNDQEELVITDDTQAEPA